ncbi:MAG: NUDIX domain-containing protein [Bacteroidales bacterium]|jgi:ADP-ribose pyrophosphatase YjhB (NUDIX family)
MYSIYFNNRCLAVCSSSEQLLNDTDAVIFSPSSNLVKSGKTSKTVPQTGEILPLLQDHTKGALHSSGSSDITPPIKLSQMDLSDLPALFQNTPNIRKLYIPSNQELVTFKRLCTKLTSIQAGGGLVTNNKGEYLLIFRHGVWDLPKGKQEPNEDIRQAALREVEEECGVHDLEIKQHLCDTYHTYQLNGKFMLKCTHWYKMEYLGSCPDTKPQTEESIERAIWVTQNDLPDYLSHTYPSIQEVFRVHAGQ